MKSIPLKYLLFGIVFLLMFTACNRSVRQAERTAKDFLHAYYIDLDFAKAINLSTDISHVAIYEQAELISLNPYAKEETPVLVFKEIKIEDKNETKATFTYSANRIERTLPLRKLNGVWLVDLQGGTVEVGGVENNMMELSLGEQGGFATATSGPITYNVKRKK